MILVDTSVWIDHFRRRANRLHECLERGIVLVHPFMIGEIARGNLKNRSYVLSLMSNLPSAVPATDKEVLEFTEKRSLHGRGVGYMGTHLLASSALTPDARLWTMDTRLHEMAQELHLSIKL